MKPYVKLAGILLLIAIFVHIYIPTAEADVAELEVPVIMYHSLHPSASDKWVLGPDQFEQDLRYLSENGYTTVTPEELAAFVNGEGKLPQKPIVLTFDDGYYNNLTKGMPLLEKYDMKIVLAVIGEHADIWTQSGGADERHGHATWPQLADMVRSGRVELSNHTHSLHTNKGGRRGCTRKKGEDEGSYRQMLSSDLQRLQDRFAEHCGVTPISFAYPYGSICGNALEVLRDMGFMVTFTCVEGVNTIRRGEPEGLIDMYRYNRSPGRSVENILSGLSYKSSP